jgi:hypothetical protein
MDDPEIVCTSLVSIKKFVRNPVFLNAMLRSQDLLHAVINIFNATQVTVLRAEEAAAFGQGQDNANATESSKKSLKDAAHICLVISQNKDRDAVRMLLEMGALRGLTELLSCREDGIMYVAISAVHNLLLTKDERLLEETKGIVRGSNGILRLLNLLQRADGSDKLLSIVVDVLRILALKHDPSKKIIQENKGPEMLINILQTRDRYPNLIMYTSKFLKGMPKKETVIE